jgi:ketosteroid isomerase-like protein
MANGLTNMTDETFIRDLLEKWAAATRPGNNDEVLANQASDVTIFDLHELKIRAGQDVAFARCFIQCGGTQPDGKKFDISLKDQIEVNK